MRSRLLALLTGLALLAAAPGLASAASIAVDRPCYADPSQRSDMIALTGSGFTPGAPYQVTLDGEPLPGAGTADAAGNLSGSFASPALDEGVREQLHTLGVQEGANTAQTQFTVSRLAADFTPFSGDPRTLRVRFSLSGFSLSGAGTPPIYVHYVRPGTGKVQQTVRLGTGRGPCGSIARTARRRLFGFPARTGTWRLQFDSHRTYTRGTRASTFLFFVLPVVVRAT